ncbi:hypothetical protein F4810DRAFT_471742 [Camillea tinctor]|nr:hypothetical protein F4810DRAFT_471742 [Camillea tinctor]
MGSFNGMTSGRWNLVHIFLISFTTARISRAPHASMSSFRHLHRTSRPGRQSATCTAFPHLCNETWSYSLPNAHLFYCSHLYKAFCHLAVSLNLGPPCVISPFPHPTFLRN